MHKEVRKLIQSISTIPDVAVEVGGQHVKVLYRDRLVTTISSTPSDHRWRDNAVADLRRAGITPSIKPKTPVVEVDYALTIEQLRESLTLLFASKRGTAARFARFTQDEVAPMLGLQPYKSFAAAEQSISSFTRRKQKGLSQPTFLLVSESLRLWEQQHRSMARTQKSNGSADAAAVFEPAEPEKTPPSADPPAVHVVVDLEFLNTALAKLGLRLEVH